MLPEFDNLRRWPDGRATTKLTVGTMSVQVRLDSLSRVCG